VNVMRHKLLQLLAVYDSLIFMTSEKTCITVMHTPHANNIVFS
jgi:hypothetical protein